MQELQSMVKMLTTTVGAISTASQMSVDRLGEIEKEVARISILDDVRMIGYSGGVVLRLWR